LTGQPHRAKNKKKSVHSNRAKSKGVLPWCELIKGRSGDQRAVGKAKIRMREEGKKPDIYHSRVTKMQ